jgi:endonuclease I
MRHLTKYLCCGLLLLIATAATTAQPLFPGLEGQPLLDALEQAYKPDTVLDYAHARDTMYARIYNQHDSVQCVYSGHRLYLQPGTDPSTWLYLNGSSNGINCEHTWPQSKGAQTGNPESDMHHLFPVRSAVNTARDNFPFSEIPDPQATQWYYLDQVRTSSPPTEIDLWSERRNGTFEPREDHKGNVARAMFYFNTMYHAEAQAADPAFFELQRQTLCAWHYLDPADSLETARTWLIASYQDGKPNPYVLDCTLAARTFCPDTPGECPLVSSSGPEPNPPAAAPMAIVPNPATTAISLQGPTLPGLLTITDPLGRLLLQRPYTPGDTIETSDFPAGIYIVVLQQEFSTHTARLLKL